MMKEQKEQVRLAASVADRERTKLEIEIGSLENQIDPQKAADDLAASTEAEELASRNSMETHKKWQALTDRYYDMIKDLSDRPKKRLNCLNCTTDLPDYEILLKLYEECNPTIQQLSTLQMERLDSIQDLEAYADLLRLYAECLDQIQGLPECQWTRLEGLENIDDYKFMLKLYADCCATILGLTADQKSKLERITDLVDYECQLRFVLPAEKKRKREEMNAT